MPTKKTRAFVFGIVMFLALIVAKIVSGKAGMDVQTFLPAAVGGLAGGLVVYFFGGMFTNRKK